jgi:uncharacterized repeat protein (TIGR01451 family)
MTKSKILKGLLSASALTVFSTGTAFAQNNFTPAETDVANTFSLSYNVGTVPQPPITNDGVGGNDAPTVFRVDRLVNVTVASSGTPGAFSPNQQNASVEFSVRNDGNDTHAYALDFEEVASPSDDFDTDASTSGDRIIYFLDTNGDGVLSTGETEVIYDPADVNTWPVLDPDATMIVRVTRDIPQDALDGEQADINLFADTRDTDAARTATVGDNDTTNSTLVTENVLADADGPASAANDTGTDGAHSATNSFVVLAADVTATKDVFVVSEVPCVDIPAGAYTPPADNAGNYSIPNACVEYVITVENDGTAAATAIDLLDELPDNLLFRDAAILGDLTGTFSPALPPQGTECTSSPANCAVNVSAGSIPGKAAPGDAPNVGYLVIRATIK